MKDNIKAKKKINWLILTINLSVLFLCVFLITSWRLYVWPYSNFKKQAHEMIPQYDALNFLVYKDIPSPPQNTPIKRMFSNGIDSPANLYGRNLYIEYDMGNLSSNEIFDYYARHLIKNQWSASTYSEFATIFIKGNACVSIEISENLGFYNIHIWHDFLGQEFSPTFPDLKHVNIYGMGEYDLWSLYTFDMIAIVTCPL